MTRKLNNIIGLGVEDTYDEMCIQFGQDTSLDEGMEVMVYNPPDYDQYSLNPDDVDDRVGSQVVIIRSARELATLLEEVFAGDFTRFNRLGDTSDA
jgi:hypothetical protein